MTFLMLVRASILAASTHAGMQACCTPDACAPCCAACDECCTVSCDDCGDCTKCCIDAKACDKAEGCDEAKPADCPMAAAAAAKPACCKG